MTSLAAAKPGGAKDTMSDADKAAQKTMAAELRRGRQLADKGKHAEAVVAFEAALRAVPGEPRVLLEMGAELRAAGDLARAEEFCHKAVAASPERPIRAPALFNLGRVLEAKKDKPGAIAAYRESLALRENRIVRERLLDLDPTASDAAHPEPLDGPQPTIAAWCAAQKDEECHLKDDEAAVTARLPAAAGPWKEARIFTIGASPEDCVLAVRTAGGWFFRRLGTCRDGEFRYDVKATVEAEDVLASPGPELIIGMTGTDAMKDFDPDLGHSICCIEASFESVTVCGVGPSKVPSCTPTIDLLPGLEAPKGVVESGLTARWNGDELVLERADGKPVDDKKARLAPALRDSAGRHRIVFP